MNGSSSNSFINIYNNTALTSISCSSGVNIYNNNVVSPWHTVAVPVIAAGNAFTVIVFVDLHPVAVNVYAITGLPAAK